MTPNATAGSNVLAGEADVGAKSSSLLSEGSFARRAVFVAYAISLFLIPLNKLNIPVGGTKAQAADFAFLITTLIWLVCVARRELPLVGRNVVWPLAGLVGMSLVSFSASQNLKHSFVKLIGLGYLIALAAVTASLGSTKRGLRFVLGAWVAAATPTVLLGLFGVLLFYAGVRDRSVNFVLWTTGTVPAGLLPRIAILFENANMLCSYLLVSVGACVALRAVTDSPSARRWLLVLAALTAFVCVFTLSTGLGGLALGIAVAWALRQQRRGETSMLRESAIVLAGIVGAVGMLVATVLLLAPKGAGDVSVGPFDILFAESGRVSAWKGALDTVVHHPLRGVGLGATVAFVTNPRAAHVMEHWGTAHMDKPVALHMEAHNIWLNVAGQIGIPGLIAFVALMFLLCRGLLPATRDASPLGEARIALFGAFVGAVLFHGLAAALEDSRQYWYLFGLIVAVKLVVERDEATRAPSVT